MPSSEKVRRTGLEFFSLMIRATRSIELMNSALSARTVKRKLSGMDLR